MSSSMRVAHPREDAQRLRASRLQSRERSRRGRASCGDASEALAMPDNPTGCVIVRHRARLRGDAACKRARDVCRMCDQCSPSQCCVCMPQCFLDWRKRPEACGGARESPRADKAADLLSSAQIGGSESSATPNTPHPTANGQARYLTVAECMFERAPRFHVDTQ